MDRTEKANELIERAKKLGVRVETVLETAHGNGAVTISVTRENFRDPKVPLTARADNFLIIMEKADGTSSPLNDGPKAEQPRKGIFELSRRSSAGSSVERDRS
jgi:hypothetical protein